MKGLLFILFFASVHPAFSQVQHFMIQKESASYTIEQTIKAKPSNQFLSATNWSTWQGMPANGSGNVTAGAIYSDLRDITNTATSVDFVAVDGFTGSSGSVSPTTGTDVNIFCSNTLTSHGWTTTASTVNFRLTGLTVGKYYQIGLYSSTFNYLGISISFGSGINTVPAYATGNNYGTCGPGDDLDDPAIKWIYNIQPNGSGEIDFFITRTAGTETGFGGLIIQRSNIAKP
jgi:hypothetical protein